MISLWDANGLLYTDEGGRREMKRVWDAMRGMYVCAYIESDFKSRKV